MVALGAFPRRTASHPRLRPRQVLGVARRLSLMVRSGVDLSTALREMGRGPRAAGGGVLAQVREEVQGGRALSGALARHPDSFGPVFVHLVRAGEEGGSLGEMLERSAEELEREEATRSALRAATAYPAFMATVALAVTCFLGLYVLPRFAEVFSGREDALPLPTRALLAFGAWASRPASPWLVLGSLVVGIATALRWARGSGRPRLQAALMRAPLVGPTVSAFALARSMRTLGVLLRHGVPIVGAMAIAAEVSGLAPMARLWRRCLGRVERGEGVHRALEREPLFPTDALQMVRVGEASGHLPEVLVDAADGMHRDAQARLRTLTTLLEPALIVVMGLVVGFVVLSLMLPMFTMSRMVAA
ncbi:MAG: type II secretion system F family protein [Planctomycetes bacterium]|nr:type II secretion system F family protein [Planctomycetota bacterium]